MKPRFPKIGNRLKRASVVALIAVFLFVIGAAMAFASGNWLWSTQYAEEFVAFDNATDSNGNIYIVGESTDATGTNYFTLIKYTSAGAQEWARKTDGGVRGEDREWGCAIAVDSNDNPVIVGAVDDRWLIKKYDGAGNTLWSRTKYTVEGGGATNVAIDSLDYVLVAGEKNGEGRGDDTVVVKYDSNGNQEWVGVYDGLDYYYEPTIALDVTDNAYVGGNSLTKFQGTDGALLWSTETTSGAIQVAQQGGGVYTISNWPDKWHTKKFSADTGELLWSKVKVHAGDARVNSMGVDASGNVYASGHLEDSAALVKNDSSSGNEEWVRSYGGATGTVAWYPWNLTVDDTGNSYIVAQVMLMGIMGSTEIGIVKYDTSGNVVWSDTFGPVKGHDYWPIAVDDSGLYPIAVSPDPDDGILVIKYAP